MQLVPKKFTNHAVASKKALSITILSGIDEAEDEMAEVTRVSLRPAKLRRYFFGMTSLRRTFVINIPATLTLAWTYFDATPDADLFEEPSTPDASFPLTEIERRFHSGFYLPKLSGRKFTDAPRELGAIKCCHLMTARENSRMLKTPCPPCGRPNALSVSF